jgi:hypothetical protein
MSLFGDDMTFDEKMAELSRLYTEAQESQARKLNEIMMRKKPFKIGNGGKPIILPL